jgi:hypothetical protein
MKDEMAILHEAFGPDEAAPEDARLRARTALLDRMAADNVAAGRRPARRTTSWRWAIGGGLTATTAAVIALTMAGQHTAVDGPVDRPVGASPAVAQMPFAKPAGARQLLENAAWTASRKPWQDPRPDQFMYKESRALRNEKKLEQRRPNGPLVPGRTRMVKEQHWDRIDGQVTARMVDGKLIVERQSEHLMWVALPYDDLVELTTPEKVVAWEKAPKKEGAQLDALLGQYVLPPAVEAAVFRAIAKSKGAKLNPDAVNLDGRPAVALRLTIEGYLSNELLFDKDTYAPDRRTVGGNRGRARRRAISHP